MAVRDREDFLREAYVAGCDGVVVFRSHRGVLTRSPYHRGETLVFPPGGRILAGGEGLAVAWGQ